MSAAPSFVEVALRASVVRRAIGYTVVVGSVLIAINHGDAILAGEVAPRQWLKMGLTALVPYCVSTLSSVGALREAQRARR